MPTVLTEFQRLRIKVWLNKKALTQTMDCPFHTYRQTELIPCATLCHVHFPDTYQFGGCTGKRCPCYVYPLKEVIKKAAELIR